MIHLYMDRSVKVFGKHVHSRGTLWNEDEEGSTLTNEGFNGQDFA